MHIFISYSKTREVVASLAQDFEALGHSVWFDQELIGGQDWWDGILENIRACDLFVFALSPQSLASYPCQLEYTYAGALNKRILPVLIGEINVSLLPPLLSTIQFVDYRQQDKKAAFALLTALNKLPDAVPMPDPMPTPPTAPVSPLGKLAEWLRLPEDMTRSQQADLLMSIKDAMRSNPGEMAGARDLLAQMKQRPDLFASIAADIDTILANASTSDQRSALPIASVPKYAANFEASMDDLFAAPPAEKGTVEAYLQHVTPKLRGAEFDEVMPPNFHLPGVKLLTAYARRRAELKLLGLVDTVCVISRAHDGLSADDVKAYCQAVYKYAPGVKGGLPVGYGRALKACTVLVGSRFSDEVRDFVRVRYAPEHTAACEFPILVELETGDITCYEKTPTWGLLIYNGLRDETERLFKPE
jgi:hypothetical protein